MPEKSTTRLKAESLLLQKSSKEVAQELFAGSNWKSFESFYRHVRGWKKKMDGEGIHNTINRQQTQYTADNLKVNTTKSTAFNKLKTELGLHENTFNLPEPLNDEIEVVQLATACNKILLLSDIHVPFHTIEALTASLKFGRDRGVNTIYINGDGIDFYGISRFEKEKRLRSLKNEIEQFRELVEVLDRVFPNAVKYYKMGNHCARWDSYIRQNAKEFEDIDDFAFANVMRLNHHNWKIIGDRDFAKAGKLHILHGHEMMQAVSPVNPARGVYLKAMQSCIVGHHHRTSEHSGKNIGGDFITCWSTGCLSQLRPKYNPLSSYNHGFALIETEASGDFRVENKRIDNGKIY